MRVKSITFNCRRLWRIWNFFLIISLYAYLTYDSISRYIAFKKSSMDLAFGSIYCPVIMNLYIISIIAGLTFITISLYCLVCSNGNYGDDSIRLGRDTDNLVLYEELETINNEGDELIKKERKDGYLLRRFKRNFLPFSCLFHYFSAMCFLIPMPFVEAHQIKQRVLSSNNLWHSDLDFIFGPDNWHRLFVSDISTNWVLRPQYFNLILSLVSMSVRYAGVFWACHRWFSFIFSFLMMLSSLHILLDYSTTSILIHIAYNPDLVSTSLRVSFLSTSVLLALSIIGSTVILVTFWCVFEFGFQQFLETLQSYRQVILMQSESSHDGSNTADITCCKKKHLYLRGYLPHLSAVFGGAIGVGMKFPLYYAGVSMVYNETSDPMVLTNFLISITFICIWLITWFGFSLKPTWSFMISSYSKTISDISSTTTTVVQPPRKQSFDQNNQVYTCFHNPDNRLVMDENNLQNRLRDRDYYPDETDLNNAACTNYVYLQSAMNPALNPMIISQSLLTESPLVASFIDNADQRNLASESESSYDSAINIRNQLIATMDPQMARSQSQTIRNFGVLKYAGGSLRAHTPEYIPFQNEVSCGSTMKFENCSPDTSTLHAAESDTTLKSNPGSQQQLTHSSTLNRQNSNKKRTFGQRVTFKDDQTQDVLECSPNNSDLSSNNTNSSDSGIDSNSKNHRYLQNLQTNSNFTDLTDTRSASVIANSKSAASTVNHTHFGFEPLTSNQEALKHSTDEGLLGARNEEHSLSYVSEDDQESRLCSQV